MGKLLEYLSEKYAVENIEEVNRRLLELSSLFEISQTLNRSLNLKSILDNVLLIPMGRMMISRGMILLKEADQLVIANKKGAIPNEEFTLHWQSTTQENWEQHEQLKHLQEAFQLPLLLPLQTGPEIIGFLCLGKKLNNEPFSEEEITFLESLASIAATSIQNARQLLQLETMNLALQEKVKQLATVLEVSQHFLGTLEEKDILLHLLEALITHLKIHRYATYQVTATGLSLNPSLSSDASLPAHLTEAVPVFSDIIFLNRAQPPLAQFFEQGFQVAIPLQHQQQLIALILLGTNEHASGFQQSDQYFFQTLANQASIAIANVRLFQQTLEKERLEREIAVAREIQLKLLPEQLPELPGYELQGLNIPSRTVGGDYYDVIPVSSEQLALAIGDVTGKGIPAAMLMANLQSALYLLIQEDLPLHRVLERLNALFYNNTPADKFVTLFVALLHPAERRITYVNGGHNYPLLITADGTVQELQTGGLLVGAFPQAQYTAGTIQLPPQSLLFTYTDGITELTNPRGEEFGEERLKHFLVQHRELPLPELMNRLKQQLYTFARKSWFEDDVTALALKVLSPNK